MAPFQKFTAVDHFDNPIFQLVAPELYVYFLKLLAVVMTVAVAPPHMAIAVNNMAEIGAFR